MENLYSKQKTLCNALDRLEEAVEDFDKVKTNLQKTYNFETYQVYQDSIIKRFCLAVDLFWTCIKLFLEEEGCCILLTATIKSIIKTACNTRLITEQDAEKILDMIDDRNKSSHLYKEEIADQISSKIGDHYKIMRKYIDKLAP